MIFLSITSYYLSRYNHEFYGIQQCLALDSAFTKYNNITGYSHIADFEEIRENEFNLNVPRYVDVSEKDEEIDIQQTIDELKKLEIERNNIGIQVKSDMKELGFRV
jgi:type I restriction enzyme M protein